MRDELMWRENKFFGNEKGDFNIKIKNPDNTLIYINQGSMTVIKGNLAIYNQRFILGQIIFAQYHNTYLLNLKITNSDKRRSNFK